jgi:Tripartite tricarboxylate transporter TctB family
VRASGGALFSLGLALVAGYAVVAAWAWPAKAALFPLVTGIPLFALAVAQLVLQLRTPEPPATEDPELPAPKAERRRTLGTFGWMAGFIALVVLAGFPTTVPVFVFSYLMVQRAAPWWQSIALAAVAWGLFHLLFERLLRFPFDGGLVRTWLGLE